MMLLLRPEALRRKTEDLLMKNFTWDICRECNFECGYCFNAQAGFGIPVAARSPGEIEEAWKKVFDAYGRCFIRITGGEPFLYPYFAEIISRITKFHKVHVTSNLSQGLDDFVSKTDPRSVEMNSTFHPSRAGYGDFANQVLKLRRAGFKCEACYLAHPSQLREMGNAPLIAAGHGRSSQ